MPDKRIKVVQDKRIKVSQDKRKSRTAKAEPAPEQIKTEPAKSSDDQVITWTKKDMSVGSRLKNWLGF